MDVTPSPKMFEAMEKVCDMLCGEKPHPKSLGPAADKVRENRRMLMDFLHTFAALCMREGVNRKVQELQAKKVLAGGMLDGEDLHAMQRATEDAAEGRRMVHPERRIVTAVAGAFPKKPH